jgi:hypothetical protein
MSTAATADPQALAATLLDPDLPCPPDLVAWNGSDPAVRLGVHRNNVISSLVSALADSFPVVQALVGEAFFRAMAAVFVRQSPPRSRVLALYGDAFPAFIASFEPARSLPYLPDVAGLEMARWVALHAADVTPVPLAALQAALADPAGVAGLRLGLTPGLGCLDSEHAAVSIWAAHQGQGALAEIDLGQPESAVVLREACDVLVLPVPRASTALVRALQAGWTLGEAAQQTLSEHPDLDLGATVALLLRHGAIANLQPSP